MEGSSLKDIALELKNNLMGTLETNVTKYPQPQPQPSTLTQPSSSHTRIMKHQTAIQLETCESMITASKALAQDVSENTKGRWKKITYMYKNMLFAMNSEDEETPADKINTKGYKYPYRSPQSLDNWTETTSNILCIFKYHQCKTNILRIMVVDL